MSSFLAHAGSSKHPNAANATNTVSPSHSTNPRVNTFHRRIFVGPMPERAIASSEGQSKKVKSGGGFGSVFSLTLDTGATTHSSGDDNEEVARVLKANAYRYYLNQGGKAEDWREEDDQDFVDELLQRWKQSEWGQYWTHRRSQNAPAANLWFGTSFEIGTLMGVDITKAQDHVTTLGTRSTKVVAALSRQSLASEVPSLSPTTGQETFITAESTFGHTSGIGIEVTEAPSNDDHNHHEVPTPASSNTGLLPPKLQLRPSSAIQSAKSEPPLRPSLHQGVSLLSAQNDGQLNTNMKGKARVHYADIPDVSGPTTPGPAPPHEVLERTQDTVDPNTSLAATFTPEMKSPTLSEFRWGDTVLRDRMLVRIDYTESEAISQQFDDNINRTTRDSDFEDWGEFLVVWRKDSIEIYRDHATPGKEWITRHKHLSYVIPLRSSRTRLSLYSFVDLTFCITCAPTTTSLDENATRWIFRRAKQGTNIFIFKLKSRSRAYDWYWQLWRQMGGRIPRSMDIHNPHLNTKVTIDIPDADGTSSADLYRIFRRENLIQLSLESLQKVPDYKYLIENAVHAGKTVQLAWRYQANLDWVWLDDDVFGESREWAVLCGLAFKQATRTPSLEIRLAEHAPNLVHLKDGRRVDEPPAIEGYLDRIRPNTQTKHQVYLSTHSGYLFFLNSNTPFPPTPPGLAPVSSNVYSDAQTLKHAETRRGINQISTATGMMDLRTIVAVRRAFQPAPVHSHNQKERPNDDYAWFEPWMAADERSAEDDSDEGGESGLGKASDRVQMKMRRSFELLLNSGLVVRFEAYSTAVAIEWIERLRALIFYWKRRHRIDAKQEIELAQAQRPRLTPQTRVNQDDHEVAPEAPADLSAPYPAIDSLYNWCALEGCKPIVKTGRVYLRKGIRGHFHLVQLFLVAGHLLRFKIKGGTAFHGAVKKKINLLDAYVCSGFFAAQALPKGEYKPNALPVARRYGDGLETDDREEDMMFVIWYRPQPHMLDAEHDPTTTPVDSKTVPELSTRLKVLIFKTRSVLERDAWCWAINSEIEKIMRTQSQREMKLRDTGNLVKLGKSNA